MSHADTADTLGKNASKADTSGGGSEKKNAPTRRDFLYLTAGAMGAVGTAGALWPFLNSMLPAADTLAMATTEVSLAPIEPGQAITVKWRGQPVFIRYRTEQEIEAARQVDLSKLRDKEPDSARVKNGKEQWLVMVGVCTHLGCVPLGQNPADEKGEFNGWFCPCHGSHYDEAGRIRKGPAPKNLVIPPYEFLDDKRIRIG